MVYFEVCRSICDLFHYIYRICLHALKEEKTKMNQKDKVIEALKGMILTIMLAIAIFYLMKYFILKFSSTEIDVVGESLDSLRVFSEPVFFYLPKFEWLQKIECLLIYIFMIYGGPVVLALTVLFGIEIILSAPVVYVHDRYY